MGLALAKGLLPAVAAEAGGWSSSLKGSPVAKGLLFVPGYTHTWEVSTVIDALCVQCDSEGYTRYNLV
jgi:hypothetical protein